VRVFVTGGTGFIGGRLVARLREDGDHVVAVVRSPSKAAPLADLGCELVQVSLVEHEALRSAVEGADAVIHAAGAYEVGIPASQRPAMYEANVSATETVLDAAVEAGVSRVVYVSTVNAFGNTHGKVVDESYRRPEAEPFVSYYDETKYLAHSVAEDRIARGAPVVIAMPSAVYGPGDHTQLGNQLRQAAAGTLPFVSFPRLGVSLVHVEDVADGLVRTLRRGRDGRSYVIAGEVTRLGEALDTISRLAGKRPPRFRMPTFLIKAAVPFQRLVTGPMGLPPNLREVISAADGVTYWATHARADEELGYAPRELEQGLGDLLAGR
jgi:nucleoside-diphosphate-sugar epimerase